MELDLDFVRGQFPAFADPQTRDWAFFENAGGSYVPATVISRLQRFFVEHKVQPYGAFALSKQAGEEMDESYAAIAELINAAPEEITIGPSTTLNLYVLAQSLRHLLRPGDEIIVTNQDHEANVGCWRRLSEHGIIMREWCVGKADAEPSEALKKTEGQGHFFNEEKSRYRLNPAGPQHAQIAALAGVTEYFDALHQHHFGDSGLNLHQRAHQVFELVGQHEAKLANMLLDYLKDRDGIRLLGQDHATPGSRASTIAFHARAMPSAHIAQQLAEQQIGVGAGDFYALRCVEALGMDPDDGVVRVSMVHYNTAEEVQKLIEGLDTILPGD